MSQGDVFMLVGLGLNLIATIGGFVKLVMLYERRLTRIETRLDYIHPESRHAN